MYSGTQPPPTTICQRRVASLLIPGTTADIRLCMSQDGIARISTTRLRRLFWAYHAAASAPKELHISVIANPSSAYQLLQVFSHPERIHRIAKLMCHHVGRDIQPR